MISSPVSPRHFNYCCPVVVRDDDSVREDGAEDEVNPKHALLSDPIVGMERVTWDDGKRAWSYCCQAIAFSKIYD